LKKQSQFVEGQNDVKLVLTMVYGDFNDFGRRKNKPNSKPIAGLWPKRLFFGTNLIFYVDERLILAN
jgi:hypothetical protein